MSDRKETCAKCMDGDIEPRHCEYYGEPNGCNSPSYGQHPTTEKSSAVGNAAALREALIKALTLIHVCDWPPWVSLDGVAEVVREIDSALDKPPRQCDVGTAEEQEERFKHFCASNYSACDVDMECCRCPLESEKASCEFAWAQMPYAEERKGEGDGV